LAWTKALSRNSAFGVYIFLMAAVVIPNIDWGNRVADENICINNLRGIFQAKAEWAQINHKLPTDIPTITDLIGTNKFLLRSIPVCPFGGTYTIGAVNENPKCSLATRGHKLP
jgi:hypothetical protein